MSLTDAQVEAKRAGIAQQRAQQALQVEERNKLVEQFRAMISQMISEELNTRFAALIQEPENRNGGDMTDRERSSHAAIGPPSG